MLKAEGRTGWNGPRDTPLVRSYIAHVIDQQLSEPQPPATQSEEFGEIPF